LDFPGEYGYSPGTEVIMTTRGPGLVMLLMTMVCSWRGPVRWQRRRV
jgi:hypothetical protein